MPINLQNELTTLRRSILHMGAKVEQRFSRAIDALLQSEVDIATSVRRGDDEIDEMEVDIESECLRILALSQPVASDLRFVLSVMRINTDLERIGDHAKSIAKRVIDLYHLRPIEIPAAVRQMGERSQQMMADALVAFSDEDVSLAASVRRADQRVDDLHKEVFAWAKRAIPENVEATEAAIDVLSVARKLERVADLCTNIAEDVIFLVEGEMVRHTKVS